MVSKIPGKQYNSQNSFLFHDTIPLKIDRVKSDRIKTDCIKSITDISFNMPF
jgi:hypothetical protein